MECIIDTSAIIAVVANEPEKQELIQITKEATLIAPQSVHWEIGNAFSAMLKRRRITKEKAFQALTAYYRIPLRLVAVELHETIELAVDLDLYAYDAYLIRCAIKFNAPLLSLDRGLIYAAKEMKVKVLEVNQ